jgi:tetratricopeptide (TPR) repeat protein
MVLTFTEPSWLLGLTSLVIISLGNSFQHVPSSIEARLLLKSPLLMATTANQVASSITFSQLADTSSAIERISDPDALLSLELAGLRCKLVQKTTGLVPRAQLPAALILESNNTAISEIYLFWLLEESLRWYLDNGGRIRQLLLYTSGDHDEALQLMGFDAILDQTTLFTQQTDLHTLVEPSAATSLYSANPARIITHCQNRIGSSSSLGYSLYDIIGRLYHDSGQLNLAIEAYTLSLGLSSAQGATFRNLGSAYHATGSMQLAFASYQQAVQLDEKDALVYLKLAFFYEDFARKEWIDAEMHAEKCYR